MWILIPTFFNHYFIEMLSSNLFQRTTPHQNHYSVKQASVDHMLTSTNRQCGINPEFLFRKVHQIHQSVFEIGIPTSIIMVCNFIFDGAWARMKGRIQGRTKNERKNIMVMNMFVAMGKFYDYGFRAHTRMQVAAAGENYYSFFFLDWNFHLRKCPPLLIVSYFERV